MVEKVQYWAGTICHMQCHGMLFIQNEKCNNIKLIYVVSVVFMFASFQENSYLNLMLIAAL